MARFNVMKWLTGGKVMVPATRSDVMELPLVPEPGQSPAPASDKKKRPLPTGLMDWGYASMGNGMIINTVYDGEQNFGDAGPVIKPRVDHYAMGTRSWNLYLTTEVAWTMTDQKGRWILGRGLQLKCEPQKIVLATEGITLDPEKSFNRTVEALWRNHAFKSTAGDYARRVPLHKVAAKALKNAMVWGDVLVILRVDGNNNVNAQLIDGQHISTPPTMAITATSKELVDNYLGYDYINTATGNRVRWGVEISDTGEHVAYHVRVGIGLEYKRVAAKDRNGALRAYMVYGSEYRLDNTRGIPAISPNIEGIKQLQDYTSAMVGTVVERAKTPYTINHAKGTNDENPFGGKDLASMVGVNMDLPTTSDGTKEARLIGVTANKTVVNLPEGASLATIDAQGQDEYVGFYKARTNSIYATGNIPPEVASQMYGGSYSASRAATNGFQYMLSIDRADFGDSFYQPFFNLQLDMWVMTGKVQAPGYSDALTKGKEVILAAYRYAEWVGKPVPQIDQLKEIQAARLALGLGGAFIPLDTNEHVVSDLGNGDWEANMQQYAREVEAAKAAGLEVVYPKGVLPDPVDSNESYKEADEPPAKK